MPIRLYVGNLPYSVNEQVLREQFAVAGTVLKAVIVGERQARRSQGFGFVEMANAEDAAKAIALFNDREYQGRKLNVCEARPKDLPTGEQR
jgi:RNA recognition motif-containing protein